MEYGSEAEITDEISTIEPDRSTTKDDRTLTFHIEEPGAVGEETDKDYPFLLMVGPTRFGFGDGAWTGQSKLSLLESGEGYVSISPEDATALGVSAGSSVKLSSRRGSTTTTIEIDNSLPQKLVFIPAHCSFGHTLTGTRPETVTPNGTGILWAIDISVI